MNTELYFEGLQRAIVESFNIIYQLLMHDSLCLPRVGVTAHSFDIIKYLY